VSYSCMPREYSLLLLLCLELRCGPKMTVQFVLLPATGGCEPVTGTWHIILVCTCALPVSLASCSHSSVLFQGCLYVSPEVFVQADNSIPLSTTPRRWSSSWRICSCTSTSGPSLCKRMCWHHSMTSRPV
jgi:hypothetical protein